MSLRVSFELDDGDLTHFRLIMREARKAAARMAPEDIVATAEELLADIGTADTPGFIQSRIDNLRLLIRMLSDLDWRLPHQEATRVLNALAYFTEPDDMIPDNIPGLGFLDDAIMIELVLRELEYELEAYRDFSDFRKQHAGKGRSDWLHERREELQVRMRERRDARRSAEPSRDLRLFD